MHENTLARPKFDDPAAPSSLDATTASGPEERGLILSRVWAIMAIGLPIAVLLALRTPTVDLAYLIRSGEVMLHTHHVLRVDTFSFTVAGHPWLNQQWGAELIMAGVFRLGGWPLLVLLRGLAGGLVFSLVFLACRGRGASRKQAAMLTLASALVGMGGLLLRAQLFGVVLFALTVWILEGRRRRPWAVWLVPVIVLVWANVHGSFFLGPLLAALAYLDDLRRRSPHAGRMLAVAALSAGTACIGPFGIAVWSYALNVSTNPVIARTIVEWQVPSLRDAVGALFFASGLGAVVLIARSERRLPWTSLLTLGVFFVLGLFALRGAYWWAIVAPPLLVDALPRSTEADLPTGDRVANRGMVAVIGLLIAATLPWWRVTGSTPEAALLTRAPLGLTRTVERLVPGGARLFINQPLGSWFELALPRDRVFVDSRIELYPESVWREYADVVSGRSDWDRVLTAWGVDAIVVERSDEQNLLRFIRTSPDWTLAYRDADGLVYVHARRTPDTATPAGIIPAGVAARSLSRMA